jgi:hypothetical protein
MLFSRFFSIQKDGHINGRPLEFNLPDGAAALKEAEQRLDGKDIEIWEGARLVA